MSDVKSVNSGAMYADNLSQASNIRSDTLVGQLAGAKVEVADDPQSALADSAEELSFARDNSKQTKLKDRKQRQAALNLQERIEKLKYAYETQTDNDDHSRRRTFVERFKTEHKDLKAMLKELQQQGGHPASDYAFLLSSADKESDADFAKILRNLAQELYVSSKSEIDACLNSVETAGSSNLLNTFDLCLSYSELSHQCNTPEQMLLYLEKRFGSDNVNNGIDFMFDALAADLAAVSQSQEPVVLENVGTSLSMAQALNGASKILDGLVTRFKNEYSLNTGKMSGFSILEKMLKLCTQKFIQSTQVRGMYSDIKTQDPETEVLLAQDLLNKSRELSTEVFSGVENRGNMIDAIQNLVDKLIEKEDEWLEQGGQ